MTSPLAPVYALLERPAGYALLQRLARPTNQRFRALLRKNVLGALQPGASVIDLACGVGAYRELFPERYHGVDINPDYIAAASRRYAGSFQVMDCTRLEFPDGSFDHAVTIAGTHHFDDQGLVAMLAEALRVVKRDGCVHVVDAVLPLKRRHLWKEIWFRMDRGRHARRVGHLKDVAARAGRVEKIDLLAGPLHDVVYMRLVK